MKVNRCNVRIEITIGDGASLSARRGATVEHARAASDESCDELRRFVLNGTEAGTESRCFCDVSMPNLPRVCKKSAGSQFDPFGAELIFGFRMTETDHGYGNRLIVAANLRCSFEAILQRPAFDQPWRMGTAGGEGFYGSTANRWRSILAGRHGPGKFAQNGVHEWSSGTFASALDEFHTLVDGSAGRNAGEPTELIDGESKGGKNLEIEFGKGLRRAFGDLSIK